MLSCSENTSLSIFPQNNHSHAGCYTCCPLSKRNMQKKKKRSEIGKGERKSENAFQLYTEVVPPGSWHRGACRALYAHVARGCLTGRSLWGETVFAFFGVPFSHDKTQDSPSPDDFPSEKELSPRKARMGQWCSQWGSLMAGRYPDLWRWKAWRLGVPNT